MGRQAPNRVSHKEPKKNEVFGVVAVICGERQMSSLKLLEACLIYYNSSILTSILSPTRKVGHMAWHLLFPINWLVGFYTGIDVFSSLLNIRVSQNARLSIFFRTRLHYAVAEGDCRAPFLV